MSTSLATPLDFTQLDSLPDTIDRNPGHIWIEPTNRCNTRCIHCGHFYERFGEDMEGDLYERIESELLHDVKKAELIGYGEPFMAKNFMRMFDACVQRDIEILTTSNGILLRNEELSRKVVRNRVELCLSIDGARQETFEWVRPYVKWKGILQTLEMLKKCRDEAGDEARFKLRFNYVAMKDTIEDLPGLVELAHKYGAKCIYILPLGGEDNFPHVKDQSPFRVPDRVSRSFMEALPLAYRYNIEVLIPESFRGIIKGGGQSGLKAPLVKWYRKASLGFHFLQSQGVSKTAKKFFQSSKPPENHKACVTYCSMPWKDAYFASDGTVYPCCITSEKLGNMKQQNWNEIWNGKLFKNLRRTIHSWNPNSGCRFCPQPLGINGGNEGNYKQFFSRFREEKLSLESNEIKFESGFYDIEFLEDGTPSHRWMQGTGELTIPRPDGARFLRIGVILRAPVETTNPGKAIFNGIMEEPFDNSCDMVHFPVDQLEGHEIQLRLEMEDAHQIEGDARELALAIRGFSFLY